LTLGAPGCFTNSTRMNCYDEHCYTQRYFLLDLKGKTLYTEDDIISTTHTLNKTSKQDKHIRAKCIEYFKNSPELLTYCSTCSDQAIEKKIKLISRAHVIHDELSFQLLLVTTLETCFIRATNAMPSAQSRHRIYDLFSKIKFKHEYPFVVSELPDLSIYDEVPIRYIQEMEATVGHNRTSAKVTYAEEVEETVPYETCDLLETEDFDLQVVEVAEQQPICLEHIAYTVEEIPLTVAIPVNVIPSVDVGIEIGFDARLLCVVEPSYEVYLPCSIPIHDPQDYVRSCRPGYVLYNRWCNAMLFPQSIYRWYKYRRRLSLG
jgi:hypothetical protein